MLFNNYVDDLAHQMIQEMGEDNLDLWVNIDGNSVFYTKLEDDEEVGDSRLVHMCHISSGSQLEDVCGCLNCTYKTCSPTPDGLRDCAVSTIANEIYDNMFELEDEVREYVIDAVGKYVEMIAEVEKSVQINVMHNMGEMYEDYETPIIDDIVDDIIPYGVPYNMIDALDVSAHRIADLISGIDRATEEQFGLLKKIQSHLLSGEYREAYSICFELGDLYDGL